MSACVIEDGVYVGTQFIWLIMFFAAKRFSMCTNQNSLQYEHGRDLSEIRIRARFKYMHNNSFRNPLQTFSAIFARTIRKRSTRTNPANEYYVSKCKGGGATSYSCIYTYTYIHLWLRCCILCGDSSYNIAICQLDTCTYAQLHIDRGKHARKKGTICIWSCEKIHKWMCVLWMLCDKRSIELIMFLERLYTFLYSESLLTFRSNHA